MNQRLSHSPFPGQEKVVPSWFENEASILKGNWCHHAGSPVVAAAVASGLPSCCWGEGRATGLFCKSRAVFVVSAAGRRGRRGGRKEERVQFL